MGYITTENRGLGAITIKEKLRRELEARLKRKIAEQQQVSTIPKVIEPLVVARPKTRREIERFVEADIPGASVIRRMVKPLTMIEEMQEAVPAVLVTTTESLPLPRHSDQYVKPPVSSVITPRIVNKPQYQDVTDSPPGPTQTVIDTYVTPTALEPQNPSGAPPDSTIIRLTETRDTDRPIAIAEPTPSGVDSFGYLRPSVLSKRIPLRQTQVVHEGTPALEQSIIDYAPGTADLLQIQPLLVQTAEEAAAPTFLDVAGTPSWVMPALVAAGLYIFFGSAQTAGRRSPRRRRRR